jgi:HYR domain-containing protein
LPSADGCVRVEKLDAAGLPTSGTPTTVRFSNVVGHFSSWGVAIVSPVVLDTTPPVLAGLPANIVAEQAGPTGTATSWPAPSAQDAVEGPLPVSCVPPSGSTFGAGLTTVTCSAADSSGNTASAGFTVTIADTRPPVLAGLPANLVVNNAPATGQAVSWPAPTALDAVSGSVAVSCLPASGSTFGLGSTTVSCTARDAAGNVASGGFTVTLLAPPPGGHTASVCTTLGGARLLDLDLFGFNGSAGETVTLRLAANPAGTSTAGKAALTLVGPKLLKVDASALPNVISVTLPKAGPYLVSVGELPLKSGRFTGAYCLTLESSGNAWQSLVRK